MKNSMKALLIVATIVVAMLIVSQRFDVIRAFENCKNVLFPKIDELFSDIDEKVNDVPDNSQEDIREFHFQT